jgi:flagellar biosynthesis/type III secretory pathway protein FliH
VCEIAENVWEVFDERGVPLGLLIFEDGEMDEDWDWDDCDFANMIPLDGYFLFDDEPTSIITTLAEDDEITESVRTEPGRTEYARLAEEEEIELLPEEEAAEIAEAAEEKFEPLERSPRTGNNIAFALLGLIAAAYGGIGIRKLSKKKRTAN